MFVGRVRVSRLTHFRTSSFVNKTKLVLFDEEVSGHFLPAIAGT